MNTTNERAIATLQHLLDVCTDGVEGYRRAAQVVATPATHRALAKNAAEREEVAATLTNVLVDLGHPPPHHGTLGGAIHRGWLRALGAAHREDSILHECMRGERATIDAFAHALATDLPADARAVVQSQLGRVLTALERVDAAAPSHAGAQAEVESAPAQTDAQREAAERRAAGLPRRDEGRGLEADIGATVGFVAGATAGSIGGPIGTLLGATIGSVVGEATGAALHRDEHARTVHDHELDDAIGVTKGPIGAGAPITFVDPPSAVAFLRADHDLLDAIGDQIVAAIEENDRAETARAMNLIQTRIREHLAREERDLLPGFALHSPEEAVRVRAEHAEIEKVLGEMEIATDLHLLRADAVRALLGRLRAHAAREEGGLYAWAAREARAGTLPPADDAIDHAPSVNP